MVEKPDSKRRNYDILPSDSELYSRAKMWSKLLEKYQSVDTSYTFDYKDMDLLFSDCDKESEKSENYNVSELEAIEDEGEDDGTNKTDLSPSFQRTLNETLKAIEKRKEIWKNAGIDNVMESFCLKEIEDKVGSWLQKHVNNNMNTMNNNDDDDDDITINSTNTLYNERQQHNSVELEQMLKNGRKEQLRKRYYYEIRKKNLNDDDDDSSLESVDTAKYILSNRKPYKTKTNTMTIKRFRNIRDNHERERDLFCRKLKPTSSSIDRNHFIPIKSRSAYNYDDDSTSDESSFNEDHIRNVRRTRYSVSKIRKKRYIDDNKMKLYKYELKSVNTAPHLKYGISSKRSLEGNLKRKCRIKEKQLRDISYLASMRRTPSPQHLSSDVDNDLESCFPPSRSLSIIQEEFHEKNNKKTGAFKTLFMREDKKNNDEKAKNHKIIKPTTSISNKSTLSKFEPKTSSTVISYNYKNDKNDFFNSKIISERNYSNEKNDNMHRNISKKTTNSSTINKSNSTTSGTKLNTSNMTVIYSPQMDNSASTSNSKITTIDGKIKLTKELLENSIGEKNTEKILKNDKDKLLNYEINSDSKLIYLPSLYSDQFSSDDDAIDHLFKAEKTHIIEITADGEKKFILSM